MTQTNKDKIIDLCSISHQMTWKSFYDYRSSICNKSHRARINLYHITAFFKMRHFLLKYLLSPVGVTAWETDTRHLYAGSLGWKTRLICIMITWIMASIQQEYNPTSLHHTCSMSLSRFSKCIMFTIEVDLVDFQSCLNRRNGKRIFL